MASDWNTRTVRELQDEGILLVEDGNHGNNRPRPDEFIESGVKFIRAADMDDGRVLFESAQAINETANERVRKGKGQDGDVLLSHKGTVGKVAFVPEDSPTFVCSPQTTFWRSLDPEKLDRRFLYTYLCSHAFQSQLRGRQNESDMAGYVSLTSQRTLSVQFPPIAVQRHIANVLGTLDDKIELNRRMNRTLEAMAQAIFKSWFVDFEPVKAKTAAKASGATPEEIERAAMAAIAGKSEAEIEQLPEPQQQSLAQTAALFADSFQESELGEIPERWEASAFGAVSECLDFKRIPLSKREREKRQGKFPYYGATSIMDHVNDFLFDEILLLLGEDGSVVHSDGTPFTQYVWGKIWVNNHAHVLRGIDPVSTEQLLLFIEQTDISSRVTGAVQLKLNQKNMNSIPFVRADDAVHRAFQNLIIPLFEMIRNNTEGIKTLAQLRDALLPKLLSGELTVPEAEAQLENVET